MNVLLVSQCNKRALKETRRILDQFAERRGDRTWQTAITLQGLNALRKLLRKTARKNTAVACHWIRGRDHSELMWIVGDASGFNTEGAVPTNTTRRDILRSTSENDWHTNEDIQLLAQMAALLHDLGKASIAFQGRLQGERQERNLYRHEWVSLRLFLAFVGADSDECWLTRLANPTSEDDKSWLLPERYARDGIDTVAPPFSNLPPLAAAIAWLVVTHHRLPVKPVYESGRQQRLGKKLPVFDAKLMQGLLELVEHDWNEVRQEASAADIASYWKIAADLPVVLPKWKASASRLAKRLLVLRNKAGKGQWLDNPFVMHMARLVLMLADHRYSSLPRDSSDRVIGDAGYSVYANTDNEGQLKQPLDEHLLGVAKLSGDLSRNMPGFERHLPRLARHRGLRKRSKDARFRWQDKAFDAVAGMREQAAQKGGFIVNMASTGCGKTLANARMLYALSDPQWGMRITYALGLRTLTLQTGRSYREDLHLGEDELAVRVGGSASRTLFEFYEQQAEKTGSASLQDLLEEDSHVLYEGQQFEHPLLSKAMEEPKIRSLLSAPVLVCTVDHLTPATEAQRAGRQIAPMLRLMTSDLILDELDDFDLKDLPALTRLVYWSGLLGGRIVLSSATLPPALVHGMFLAYRAGRKHYLRNRGQHGGQGLVEDVPCLWIDEFGAPQRRACWDGEGFASAHNEFVERRAKALVRGLDAMQALRCGELLPLVVEAGQKTSLYNAFAGKVHQAALMAHEQHHELCPYTGKKVSFGLVRMANIDPLFEVARELFRTGAPENYHIHLCVYHARFPLITRSAIEQQLDTTLDRRDPGKVYQRADIRSALTNSKEQNHLFIVLGSPVTEVGRDHDYDWAIVEPSSMRSLIQLAGRVQRHRRKPCGSPNVFLFDTNLRHFSRRGKAAFVRPGFEDEMQKVGESFRLTSHSLATLLLEHEYANITSCPRIQPRADLSPNTSLVDLEHARMADQMLPKEVPKKQIRGQRISCPLNAASGWQDSRAGLTWVMSQQQPFRENLVPSTDLVFLPDEDDEKLIAHEIHQQERLGKASVYTSAESRMEYIKLEKGLRISCWGEHDLMALVGQQADVQGLPLAKCAERFTTVSVRDSAQGWLYHPVLGLVNRA